MPNLLFLMTPGVNLSTWKDNGSFSREIKPYLRYAARGYVVRIISFGSERYDFKDLPTNIEVVPAKVGISHAHLLPFTHYRHFKWADVIKTNQSYLSWIFACAAKIFSKPLLLRCGYIHGEYYETTNASVIVARVYQFFEGIAFRFAGLVQLPTAILAQWAVLRYSVPRGKISIVPNYVDTGVFAPIVEIVKVPRSIVSVGRLHPVKRFELLISACALIPGTSLTIVGEGPEKENLLNLARQVGVKLSLPGNIPNEKLPEFLGQHEVFALTSLREGHPKALLEAMSCGLPCVAVAVTGITTLVRDGVNALLTDSDIDSISKALVKILKDEKFAQKLSEQGRSFVCDNYSFEKVFEAESANIRKLVLT